MMRGLIRLLPSKLRSSPPPSTIVCTSSKIFSDAVDSGVSIDELTYEKEIRSAAFLGNTGKALELMNQMKKYGASTSNASLYNALFFGLCRKDKRVDDARNLFDEMLMKNIAPTRFTYSCLIDVSCYSGDMEWAFSLYEKMKISGIKPTLNTYHPLISTASRMDRVDLVEKFVGEISRLNLTPDQVIFNELFQCYVKHGDDQKANQLCREMLKFGIRPDKSMYDSFIVGRLKKGCVQGARDLFDDMVGNGVEHNDETFNLLIEGHCRLRDFNGGYSWYEAMLKVGFLPRVSVCNELIFGLRQKGKLKEADIVSSQLSVKGVDGGSSEDISAARSRG